MDHRSNDEMGIGLQFFGKMTASISHEIKNVMAIINESAGLLEDYGMMAEKGIPIDPEKLKVVSGRVSKQIHRAEGIIKNMNSLAHSVDELHKSVDLGETLKLSIGLAQRLADMKSVKLDLQPPRDIVTIITSPFHLLNILWQVLDFAMGASGEGKTVKFSVENRSGLSEHTFFRTRSDFNPVGGGISNGKGRSLAANTGWKDFNG